MKLNVAVSIRLFQLLDEKGMTAYGLFYQKRSIAINYKRFKK